MKKSKQISGEKRTKETPIENILVDRPFVKKRALEVLNKAGIKTAEQLAFNYRVNNKDLYKWRNFNYGTNLYLRDCLKNAGFSFEEEDPRRARRSVENYGLEETTKITLEALNSLSESGACYSVQAIGNKAYEIASRKSNDFNPSLRMVFRRDNIQGILEGILEDSVEKIQIGSVDYTGQEKVSDCKYYRLKK